MPAKPLAQSTRPHHLLHPLLCHGPRCLSTLARRQSCHRHVRIDHGNDQTNVTASWGRGNDACARSVRSNASVGQARADGSADTAASVNGPSAAKPASGFTGKQNSAKDGPTPAAKAAQPPPSSVVDEAFLRKAAGCQSINELVDLVLDEAVRKQLPAAAVTLTDDDCRSIMLAAIERSNSSLAVLLFEAMKASSLSSGGAAPNPNRSSSSSSSSSASSSGPAGPSKQPSSWTWPAASLETAAALVVNLSRSLAVKDALRIIADLRNRGMPQADEVKFGHVVMSPLAADSPLAVVQPLEGQKVVACASSRYEYDLFTGEQASPSCNRDFIVHRYCNSMTSDTEGTVVKVASEATVSTQGRLLAIARGLGLWRRPPMGGVHELVVVTPGGLSRTFRFATATADVPAKEGDRVTLVCCPNAAATRKRGLLPSSPPGYKAGEPLLASNHTTGVDVPTQRPPTAAGDKVPGWLLPAALLLAGGDAAMYLLDPALPLLAASAAAATVGSTVIGTKFVLPAARKLPEASVAAEAVRCKLLGQHTSLFKRVEELTAAAGEDVTTLARLWQLQNKMGKVGGGGTYEGMDGVAVVLSPLQTRAQKVTRACSGLEERLVKRLELIDGYARVLNMIEIEIELDTEVPDEEMIGIEQQILKLTEVEELQEQWQLQAEAQEEVEKLLRAT